MPSLTTILNDYLNWGNPPGEGPLRPNGVSRDLKVNSDADLPSTPSESAKRQMPAVQIMRDVMGGTQRLRACGTTYLPQAAAERPEDYAIRLRRSVFFNATRATVAGLTGMVFRKDPVLGEDVPQPIVGHWENIDNAGMHGDVFAREIFHDALVAGHAAILVDFPNTGGTQTTAEESAPGGPRPYWVAIAKENILSWRTVVENGVTVLTQIVLRECTTLPDGNFGAKAVERFRVLFRENGIVGFQLLEVAKDNRSVLLIDEGVYKNQTEIPVAEVYGPGRRGLFESDPPLLDLAFLNLSHFQKLSDHNIAEYKTSVPILTRIGAMTDETQTHVVVGPNSMQDLPKDGDLKYVSHDGAALEACRATLNDIVSQMATLGLSMLSPDKRAAETAEAKRIDKAASDSALAVAARGLQDAVERALGFHANYLRLEDGGSITINRDFGAQGLDAQEIAAISQLVSNGQLTPQTMWKMLGRRAVLPEDFDPDDEAAQLDADAEIKRVVATDTPSLLRAS